MSKITWNKFGVLLLFYSTLFRGNKIEAEGAKELILGIS